MKYTVSNPKPVLENISIGVLKRKIPSNIGNDPIVSSDCIGKKCGAIVDLLSTDVISFGDTCLAKVVAWYDNEMGYTHQMISTLRYLLSLEK